MLHVPTMIVLAAIVCPANNPAMIITDGATFMPGCLPTTTAPLLNPSTIPLRAVTAEDLCDAVVLHRKMGVEPGEEATIMLKSNGMVIAVPCRLRDGS